MNGIYCNDVNIERYSTRYVESAKNVRIHFKVHKHTHTRTVDNMARNYALKT